MGKRPVIGSNAPHNADHCAFVRNSYLPHGTFDRQRRVSLDGWVYSACLALIAAAGLLTWVLS